MGSPTGSSPRARSPPSRELHAFGLPLRSRSALEASPLLGEQLPSPPPPLREGVTEAHYSRWVVEDANRQLAHSARSARTDGEAARRAAREAFLSRQQQKVEDSHQQMASASAAVETARMKKLETGQAMRLQLLDLKAALSLKRQEHSAKGRALVERSSFEPPPGR